MDFAVKMINTTTKEKEREFLIECIQLYRDLPALWKVKSKEYHDRVQKSTAYQILLEKYKEMFPEATKEVVKKKINSLRTNYRKELKKYLGSIKSGACVDSTSIYKPRIYKPTLWYYNEMNFLHDQELACDSESTMSTNSAMNAEDNEDKNIEGLVSILDETETDDTENINDGASLASFKKNASKRAMTEKILMNVAYNEYSCWAMACAADLQKMDKTQQLYAKKAIAEILMEGQMGLLHRNSVKIN